MLNLPFRAVGSNSLTHLTGWSLQQSSGRVRIYDGQTEPRTSLPIVVPPDSAVGVCDGSSDNIVGSGGQKAGLTIGDAHADWVSIVASEVHASSTCMVTT